MTIELCISNVEVGIHQSMPMHKVALLLIKGAPDMPITPSQLWYQRSSTDISASA
jgi:hypothetical protein